MRDMLRKYKDTIKFVYNFHSVGPLYIWPYNGEINNEIAESNPTALKVFKEIRANAKFPEMMLAGNAQETINYIAKGEANDYILKEFNIPSVSPELANDNFFSQGSFFTPYKFVTREILRDNEPWIKYTIDKLAGEVSFSQTSNSITMLNNG